MLHTILLNRAPEDVFSTLYALLRPIRANLRFSLTSGGKTNIMIIYGMCSSNPKYAEIGKIKRSAIMSSFENLRIVDNFYQTSLFFPMPTVVISTLCEDGMTNLGPYSLVQPYYVAGKDYYAMLLSCRNSSNTAQNILRNGKCALNFIDDKPSSFKEAVKLS